VNNEQATGYAFFNWRAWAESLNEINTCPTIKVPSNVLADFNRRLSLLETFNAHATQPDGLMVPIGDTLINRTGLTPNYALPRTAVYPDGYAFGRSAWDEPDAMHWSLRFGPKPKNHGHDDHLGVTYFVDGERVLVDGAHAGYDRNADRAYLVSKSAHNTPTVVGFARAEPRASQLVSSYTDENRAVVTVRDKLPTAKSKRKSDRTPLRTRTVVADYPSRILVTFDRAQGAPVNVPWTFAPDLTVTADQSGRVVATSEKLLQVPDSTDQPNPDGAQVTPTPRTGTTLTPTPSTTPASKPSTTPNIYFLNPNTCEPLAVTINQGRVALGWRQLVNASRAIVTGTEVISLISPSAVNVECSVEQGLTRLRVTDADEIETIFTYSPNQGLR
jgi:hypothetical protein